MKRPILFLLAAAAAVSCLFAQTTQSPFSKLGYKKQVMYTSSKGEFEEFHDNADIVEIGSVYFNTKTNKVVGFISEEKEKSNIATAISAMSVDPKCEKYYWITPYAYCLNNPVKFVDPDGRIVIAADPNAIRNITNTLSKDESQYVRFNNKGLLDISLLSQYKSTSENFTALSKLANSETNYIFAVSNQDINGSKFFEKGSNVNNPNNFSYGVTNLPGAENDPSPNNNVYIYTASFLDEKTQARNTAHEGYGHAYFFELKKSDESINPNHTKGVVGAGTEYDSDTKKNVPYFIFGNTNKKLEEQIKKVEQQAIKNYEEKNP